MRITFKVMRCEISNKFTPQSYRGRVRIAVESVAKNLRKEHGKKLIELHVPSDSKKKLSTLNQTENITLT